jgi:hypothetical protein
MNFTAGAELMAEPQSKKRKKQFQQPAPPLPRRGKRKIKKLNIFIQN